MKPRLFRAGRMLLTILLFSFALWVLHRELKDIHLRDIILDFHQIPAHRLLVALGCTILSYITLTCYDMLGTFYVGRPLPYRKVSLASFIAYAFGNNLGMSIITGGSIRYRMYSGWGFSAFEITKVIGFCVLTFWLGFLTLAGAVFLIEPSLLSSSLHVPVAAVLAIGIIVLLLVGTYLLASGLKIGRLKVRGWEFSLPPLPISFGQIAVAFTDWLLAGSVLYALLPPAPGLSYPVFLGIFLAAQLTGLVSQVPGGLGVFESMILLLLPATLSSSDAAAILLAYRMLYYILPLGVAAVLLGSLEFLHQRRMVERIFFMAGQQFSGVAALVLSVATFVGGASLLFYGAVPISQWRLEWLKNVVPLPIFEISHFLGSLIGMALLLLARGLQLRIDAAYFLTLVFLGLGIAFSIFGGFHYYQPFVLLFLLLILLPSRRYFYRKASLLNRPFTAQWIGAIIIVLLSSIWLGIFSYKHVEYSASLWWRFTFSGDAPRFLRESVGAIGLGLFFGIAKLLQPGRPRPVSLQQSYLQKVQDIVAHSPKTYAHLALLGDKSFLFSQKENAFIMYAIEGGRSWVALGDPIGPKSEMAELVWRFQELSDRFNGWSIFYQVESENLPLYLDIGLTLLKLGEEGRVSLDAFSLEGGARRGMRYIKNKLEKDGCVFELIPVTEVPRILPVLRSISDEWLHTKSTREKGFSLGSFNEDYIKMFPAAIVRKNGTVVAFANVLQGAEKEELTVDLMRYSDDAADSVMEYLFMHLMLWGKQEGYHWFSLGMAPLSGLEAQSLSPLWTRFGSLVYRHGEHFYNLQGLRQYKEKFGPEWRPKYLASPGGLALPRILTNVASLISGGLTGIVIR